MGLRRQPDFDRDVSPGCLAGLGFVVTVVASLAASIAFTFSISEFARPMVYDVDLKAWLIFAVPPVAYVVLVILVAALTRLRRRRPQPAGLCPGCGYDLRATPKRCPECGMVPISEAAARQPEG